jgi:hypothetical protein
VFESLLPGLTNTVSELTLPILVATAEVGSPEVCPMLPVAIPLVDTRAEPSSADSVHPGGGSPGSSATLEA